MPSVKTVRVCYCDKCLAVGAKALFEDIQDLLEEVDDDADLEPQENRQSSCSEKGPIVRMLKPKKEVVTYTDISSFEALENFFKGEFGDKPFANKTRNKARQIKYDMRREQDYSAKESLLEGAMKNGNSVSGDSRLLSELLVLRARMHLDKLDVKEEDRKMALADAKKAVSLTPTWLEANIVAADAMEANADESGAVSILEKCLSTTGNVGHRHSIQQKQAAAAWHRDDLLAADYTSWSIAAVESKTAGSTDYVELSLTAQDVRAVSSHEFPSELWHVRVRAHPELGRKAVVRPYAPISTQQEYSEGRLRFLVKIYSKGTMSSYLSKLQAGVSLRVSPPQCTVQMPGCERGMVCVVGGSGITVGLQLARVAVQKYKGSPIRIVVCIDSVQDCVLQEDLVELMRKMPTLQVVIYVVKGIENMKTQTGKVYWRSGYITLSALTMEVHAKVAVSGPRALRQVVKDMLPDANIPLEHYFDLDDVVPPGIKNRGKDAAELRSGSMNEDAPQKASTGCCAIL
mmetsp:Transcript_22268/g.50882  ORF Transcript_22268/g.50882 Transcript_22268/m.50882 type:complete len:516 (-) Transcript_22268:84-1631(-)